MESSSTMMPINNQSQKTNTEDSNEERNAKFIKLSEKAANNLDPLEYFSRFLGIPEMILKHLTGKDLIKVSEVNPIWYNVIASSKVLMENIQVVFNENRELQPEDYDLLKNSSRMYESIEVRRSINWKGVLNPSITKSGCISNSELDFFLSKARDWKSVSIVETNFRTYMNMCNFLLSIKSSVESFSIRNSFDEDEFPFNNETFYYKPPKFPKLKHLKMHFALFNPMGLLYACFFEKSDEIERFDFKDSFGLIARNSLVSELLKKIAKLSSLSLETCECNTFINETWKLFPFKLKSLSVNVIKRSSDLHFPNLWEFINSQKVHLEELTFDNLDNDIILFNKIMRLPKLKILHLGNISTLSKDDVANVLSTSITHFKCKSNIKSDLFMFLMKSMPNVKSLHLQVIDDETFKTLLEMNRKYEELKAVRFVNGKEEKDLEVFLINKNNKYLV